MKAIATKATNKTQQRIKASFLVLSTILLFTAGTAHASHRHHNGNSGLSISLGYVYYPKVHVYDDVYRYPRHSHHSNKHHYRGQHKHHKSRRNKHGHKHHGNRHHGRDYY
jgi:hypothetical protein